MLPSPIVPLTSEKNLKKPEQRRIVDLDHYVTNNCHNSATSQHDFQLLPAAAPPPSTKWAQHPVEVWQSLYRCLQVVSLTDFGSVAEFLNGSLRRSRSLSISLLWNCFNDSSICNLFRRKYCRKMIFKWYMPFGRYRLFAYNCYWLLLCAKCFVSFLSSFVHWLYVTCLLCHVSQYETIHVTSLNHDCVLYQIGSIFIVE